MIELKIKNGTAKSLHLCDSCQHYAHIKYDNGTEDYGCRELGRSIRKRVTSCNWFSDKKNVPDYQFKALAWIIQKDEEGEIEIFDPKLERRRHFVRRRVRPNPKPKVKEIVQ